MFILAQVKITESIPREVHVCVFISLCTDTGSVVFTLLVCAGWECSCWAGSPLASRTVTMPWADTAHEVVSTAQPRLQWSHVAFWLRTEAQPRQSRSPKATRSAGAAVRSVVYQCIKRQECRRSSKDEVLFFFFFQKITWFSSWSNFIVEDTWCPPLPETLTPTQTRFSTFFLIMHGILKSAVCLWWCKILRSQYNKAPGDYFLISITTQSVIISGTNLIWKRVLRSLMMIFPKWCVLRSLMVIFLKWCVGLNTCVW